MGFFGMIIACLVIKLIFHSLIKEFQNSLVLQIPIALRNILLFRVELIFAHFAQGP